MTRLPATSLAALLITLVTSGAVRAGDLLPPDVASRLGLVEAWKRYIPVPAGAQSIVDQQLFVLKENHREYVEILVPLANEPAADATAVAPAADAPADPPATKVLVRIPTDRVGADGKEIGKKEAERLAANDVRRLKRRGINATISSSTVPRVHLYTLCNDGTLDCRDAESGEPIWLTRVGRPGLHFGALGVSEDFLSVINGANLIQIDNHNGEIIEEVVMMGVPLLGTIHAGQYAMVPTIGGGVEGYSMYDPTIDPFMELVAGSSLAVPTKSPDSTRVAWGTSQGFVYAMELAGTPSVLFRLDTDGIVSGKIASASGDRFFFGSESGQVYGLRATRSGEVMWSRPFGSPFYNGPMVSGDQLLIRTTYGDLHSLGLEDGLGTWERTAPNVDELMGVVGDNILIRTLTGSLAVVDKRDGSRVATFGEVQPKRPIVNTLTDRLYMVSESGAVQCLRPLQAVMPTFNEQTETTPADDGKAADPAAQPAATPFAPGADPFGAGGADPFGGGAGGADPFGGGDAGADPFGGGGDMEDPFGADPFGGN